MVRVARWAIVFAFLTVVVGVLTLRAVAADSDEFAKKLTGEWSLPKSRQTADDTLIVWTFKPDGIVRLDAIDVQSRKKVREQPLVGRWHVDGKDVFCTWEVWNDRQHRPAESEERFRIRSLSEKELVLLVVERLGRPVAEEELLRYKRFPGWGRVP